MISTRLVKMGLLQSYFIPHRSHHHEASKYARQMYFSGAVTPLDHAQFLVLIARVLLP